VVTLSAGPSSNPGGIITAGASSLIVPAPILNYSSGFIANGDALNFVTGTGNGLVLGQGINSLATSGALTNTSFSIHSFALRAPRTGTIQNLYVDFLYTVTAAGSTSATVQTAVQSATPSNPPTFAISTVTTSSSLPMTATGTFNVSTNQIVNTLAVTIGQLLAVTVNVTTGAASGVLAISNFSISAGLVYNS